MWLKNEAFSAYDIVEELSLEKCNRLLAHRAVTGKPDTASIEYQRVVWMATQQFTKAVGKASHEYGLMALAWRSMNWIGQLGITLARLA